MKIIINADDFGFTKGTNQAVFELARLGTLSSTTVMVTMPYAGEAIKLLEIPNFSVGLHLNLTQGKPVLPAAEVPSLVDGDGQFFTLKTLTARAKAGELKAAEVEAEIEAQWEMLRTIIGDKITHMDSHQGLNRIPFIFDRSLAFIKKRSVDAMRFYVKYYAVGTGAAARIEKPGITSLRRYGAKRILVEAYLKQRCRQISRYSKVPDGMLVCPSHDTRALFEWLTTADITAFSSPVVLEIPCHPAANMDELRDTKYTTERVEEYELLKSEAFVNALKKWKRADYRDVLQG